MSGTPTPRAKPAPAPEVPEALLNQWVDAAIALPRYNYDATIANRAAAWAWAQREEEVRQARQEGADAEYAACHSWLDINGCPSRFLDGLRDARRPSPPTLRKQALAVVNVRVGDGYCKMLTDADLALIRKALQEGADD